MKVIRIRLVPVILAISLLITIFAVAKTFAVTNAQVATETLRVREEADTKSSITMLLSAGNKVEVLEATGEWYKIKSNGKTGYVKKEFVRVLGNSEVEQTENKANNEASNKSENIVETVKQQITEGFTGSLMSPVDIKILPKINSNNIGVITQGEQIEVVEVINDWCRVQTEEAIGWVRKNAIAQKAEGEEASVQEQDVNSSNDAIVSRIAQAKLSSRSATTTRQKAATNVESTASNASTTAKKTTATKSTAKKATTSTQNTNSTVAESTPVLSANPKADEIVAYAKQYVGCKYAAGGTSPTKGFDCSGFTQFVYKHFGINLNRASSAQINNGKAVDKSQIQPGDILIFRNRANNAIGHVAIYIGNNQMVHAANTKTGVTIGSINDSYYAPRYVAARRIV